MRRRKHLMDLTPADLEQCPVWVSVMDTYEDEDDEQEEDTRWTLTPYPYHYDSAKTLSISLVCIVRAEFTLADGTRLTGLVKAKGTGMTAVQDVQPAIVTEHGSVEFYCGLRPPAPDEIARNYQRLGKKTEQVFPVQYKSAMNLAGGRVEGPYEGRLDGFYYLVTGNTGHQINEAR